MCLYNKIVLALDLSDEAEKIFHKAKAVLTEGGALYVVHVMEPLDAVYFSDAYGAASVQFQKAQDEMQAITKQRLDEFCLNHSIALDHQALIIGSPAKEIRHFAEENNAEAIVIGTHGRHGIGLLLGSTANGVLHGTPCDVLAVKV